MDGKCAKLMKLMLMFSPLSSFAAFHTSLIFKLVQVYGCKNNEWHNGHNAAESEIFHIVLETNQVTN
jgi:hypothetical protein